jgi:hypothetical protein
MDTKIIYFSPRTASNSRLALRSAVLEQAGRTEGLLALWLGVWTLLATVECIGQLGLFRLY